MLRAVPANNVRALLDYMHERQRVYLKRKARKPFPWTDDPVLRRYRLENVYREQDKETIWFATNWRKPYSEHANLWFAACLFRMVNWSPTLAEVGFPEEWNPRHVLDVLEQRRIRREKVFTSAYRVQHHGEIGAGANARYAVRVLDELWKKTATRGQSPAMGTRRTHSAGCPQMARAVLRLQR
jgi:alpha-glutamyl/putrescinyl thymine pyrophosphorylase clade 1